MGQSPRDNNNLTLVATGQPTQPPPPETSTPPSTLTVLGTFLTLRGNTWFRPKENDCARVHKSIFRRGYALQRVFHVPDRIEYFYPPSVYAGELDEVEQGCEFAGVVCICVYAVVTTLSPGLLFTLFGLLDP